MTDRLPLAQLERAAPFAERHIGPSADEQAKMLAVVGYGSLEELVADAIPDTIKAFDPLDLPAAATEAEVLPDAPLFGVLAQYPGSSRAIRDLTGLVEAAHECGALVALAADPLALTLLRPPGEMGADVAVGSSQRFGVPLWFGGPHAGFMAVRKGLERQLPGRLVGASIDVDGRTAYRLALQTREQHIRRERATSNICTAQSLPAIVASMYAVYHGPEGLAAIARRAHRYAAVLAAGLRAGGVEVVHDRFFDTVLARVPGRADAVVAAAAGLGVNLRPVDADHVGVSTDEVTTREHLEKVWRAFSSVAGDGGAVQQAAAAGEGAPAAGDGAEVAGDGAARAGFPAARDVDGLDAATPDALPVELVRGSAFLTHPVFHRYRSETAMMRYLRGLSDRDIALDRSMIPLGSCTMKLNAAAEMEPVTWPGFASLHPFAPLDQA